ncbi:ubiquitin carboxyl-terminal hydrolase 6-like [Canis aureus]
MQEDPETLLALQRANIVAQYHQAHQAGSPQYLSLWKVTDHQDFLQDKELPGPSPREAKKLHQETQRADKWIKMLKRWDHYFSSEKVGPWDGGGGASGRGHGPWSSWGTEPSSRETQPLRRHLWSRSRNLLDASHSLGSKGPPWAPLTSTAFLPAAAALGLQGVPPQVRGQVWLRLLNVNQVKGRNAGKYQVPCSLAQLTEAPPAGLRTGTLARWPQGSVAGPGVRAPKLVRVALTCPPALWEPPPGARTVREPGEPDTRREGSEGASGRTPSVGLWLLQEVGYCQGMSEIAATLLMFLPEEDAFWALAQLMTDDRHAMHSRGPPGRRAGGELRRASLQAAAPGGRRGPPSPPLHGPGAGGQRGRQVQRGSLRGAAGRGHPSQCTAHGAPEHSRTPAAGLGAPGATGWGPLGLTLAHRPKRLLKLPLEGLREFLQDSLAQPWALENEVVLRHLRASMTQLWRMRCDLPAPPPGGLRAPAPPNSACWGCPQGTEPPGPPSSSLGFPLLL